MVSINKKRGFWLDVILDKIDHAPIAKAAVKKDEKD